MDAVMVQILSAGVTAGLTALLTAYTTSKTNERVLEDIVDRVEKIEKRLYDHENRLSHVEGKLNGVGVKG